jgi:uncharacterized paraquat-inducible protein A
MPFMLPEMTCPSCSRSFRATLTPQDVYLHCPHCGERLAEFTLRPSERSGALSRVAALLELLCLLAFPFFLMAILGGFAILIWVVFGYGQLPPGEPFGLLMLVAVVLACLAYGLLLLATVQFSKARDSAEGRAARVAAGISALLLSSILLGLPVFLMSQVGR